MSKTSTGVRRFHVLLILLACGLGSAASAAAKSCEALFAKRPPPFLDFRETPEQIVENTLEFYEQEARSTHADSVAPIVARFPEQFGELIAYLRGERAWSPHENPNSHVTVEERMKQGLSFAEAFREARIQEDLQILFDPQTGKIRKDLPRNPKVSAENGSAPLRAARIHWDGAANSKKVLKDYVKVMGVVPNFELWIVAKQTALPALNKAVDNLPSELSSRIRILPTDVAVSPWAQDASKPTDGGGTLIRPESPRTTHGYDESPRVVSENRAAGVLKSHGLLQPHWAILGFDGGNIVVGQEKVFVGSALVRLTMDSLRISRSEALAVIGWQMGRPAVEVGAPIREGGQMSLEQVSFHIDLDMAVARNRVSPQGEDVIIFQSAAELLKVFLDLPALDGMSFKDFARAMSEAIRRLQTRGRKINSSEARLLDAIAVYGPDRFLFQEYKQRAAMKDLRLKGFQVRAIPGFVNFEDPGGGDRWRAIDYANVVLNGAYALVPSYGIPSLDQAAFSVYESLGYQVLPMPSTRDTLLDQGGIRCATETIR